MGEPGANATATLLREREARSLTLLLAITLIGFLVEAVNLAVQALTSPTGEVRFATLGAYVVVSVAVLAVLLLGLRKSRWVGIIGLIVAGLSATFAAVAALMLWQGFAGDAPISLITRWPLATVGMASIAAMALTLRPLYVVIVGTGVLLTIVGLHGLAALDPETTFVIGRTDHIAGIAVSTSRVVAELIFVSGTTAMIAFAAHLARQTVREAVALQRTTDQLSRYFSPDIASGIRDGGEAFLRPGGQEQDIVVMFSDLAGFTRACAGLSASEALAMLSEYQERMVDEIFKAGGTLDKFIGDGIMATFGTPLPAADAADRAVRAARGMIAALAKLNQERASNRQAPLVQRIGIHAGPAVVGNVGTHQRLEFTVIGDTVNVASRIENACKRTGRAAMISAAVVARLRDAAGLEPIGPVALDGKPQPIELYALT